MAPPLQRRCNKKGFFLYCLQENWIFTPQNFIISVFVHCDDVVFVCFVLFVLLHQFGSSD